MICFWVKHITRNQILCMAYRHYLTALYHWIRACNMNGRTASLLFPLLPHPHSNLCCHTIRCILCEKWTWMTELINHHGFQSPLCICICYVFTWIKMNLNLNVLNLLIWSIVKLTRCLISHNPGYLSTVSIMVSLFRDNNIILTSRDPFD